MFLPGQCYQFIHISCCGMHPFRSQGIHDSSHFVYRDAAHGCRISFPGIAICGSGEGISMTLNKHTAE